MNTDPTRTIQGAKPHRRSLLRIFQIGGGVLMSIFLSGLAGLRINVTNSLPIGIYRTIPIHKASLVAFCLPEETGHLSVERGYRPRGSCQDGGAPFLKQVFAVPGDRVHVSAAGIAVNDVLLPKTAPRERDREGRPLKSWPFGDYVVPVGDLWVLSTYNRYSYDSRYFGPIRSTQILYGLKSVLTLKAEE